MPRAILLFFLFLILSAPALANSAINQGSSGTVPFLDATQGVGDAAATGMAFKMNGTEVMRVTSTGSVGVGTTSPGYTLDVSGQARISANSTDYPLRINNATGSSGLYRMVAFYGAGTYVGDIYINSGQVYYTANSDYRLKENLVPAQKALERLNGLPVYEFNYKKYPGQKYEGFLAHEAQHVLPYAVSGKKDQTDDDGNPVYQTVDYSKFVPTLTKAIQELKAENDNLRARLERLEARVK